METQLNACVNFASGGIDPVDFRSGHCPVEETEAVSDLHIGLDSGFGEEVFDGGSLDDILPALVIDVGDEGSELLLIIG